jgi:hypothetical protein
LRLSCVFHDTTQKWRKFLSDGDGDRVSKFFERVAVEAGTDR